MESEKPITSIPTSYQWHFKNLYKSPFAWTVTVVTVTGFAFSRFSWALDLLSSIPWKSTLAFAAITTVIIAKSETALRGVCKLIHITKFNRIVFELLLVKNVIKNRLGIWDWATEIEKGIYLSALPLREMGFKEWIQSNNIAVLAIIDPFEITTTTLGGKAIDYSGIDHHIIFSQDFLPLSPENLQAAATWIQQQRSKGVTVLIHCKSGVGRSASCLASHYVINQEMSGKDAREKIAAKRPMIYGENSLHDQQVKALATATAK